MSYLGLPSLVAVALVLLVLHQLFAVLQRVVSHTPRNVNQQVDIHTFRDRPKVDKSTLPENTIVFEEKQIEQAKDYLSQFNVL